MSAGSTWDETALAPQALARTRIQEGLQVWLRGRSTRFMTGLTTDFDAAGTANLAAFQALATTRLEAEVP